MAEIDEGLLRTWLDHWHGLYCDLVREPSRPRFEEEHDLAGVLADFRTDPETLAKAFAPLPCGDEILERVKRCINAESQHDGLYLVPDAREITDEEIRALVADALDRGYRCCGLERPNYRVEILRRGIEAHESVDAGALVEALGDHYIGLTYDWATEPRRTALHMLSEALYTLAASFAVQGWCVTPLCPQEVREIDPWAPQLELWMRRAHAVVRWNEAGETWVAVYVG